MKIYELYKISKKKIKNISDLLLIFKSIFGFDRVKISLNSEMEVDLDKLAIFNKKIEELNESVPIQYVVENVDFLDLNLKVGKGVFIPRAETELLVMETLKKLGKNFNGNIIDLCAGSGNIGLSLKKNLPNAQVYCVEKSKKAFEYLKYNAEKNKINVNLILGDIFDIIKKFNEGSFDVIVSNPPYIKKCEICALDKNVQFEPKMALNGGENGLFFYENIISKWKNKLKTSGFFAFEIGYNQYDGVAKVCKINKIRNINYVLDESDYKRIVFCLK